MTAPRFVQAEEDDLETIEILWREAADWLASRAIDQWQYPLKRDAVRRSIHAGECWLIFNGDTPVGTLTLDEEADPEFWGPRDHPEDALYLHKMIVSRSQAGKGFGRHILEWATARAARAGKRWLRLDAWRENPGLQKYYEAQGFKLVRTVTLPSRRSGVLFERATGV